MGGDDLLKELKRYDGATDPKVVAFYISKGYIYIYINLSIYLYIYIYICCLFVCLFVCLRGEDLLKELKRYDGATDPKVVAFYISKGYIYIYIYINLSIYLYKYMLLVC